MSRTYHKTKVKKDKFHKDKFHKDFGKKRKHFFYMNPEMIMTVVISLIILAVGVFAFFVTIDAIPTVTPAVNTSATNFTYYAVQNVSATGNSVFNVVGVVLVIGAIMTIVGLVYSYVRPGGY